MANNRNNRPSRFSGSSGEKIRQYIQNREAAFSKGRYSQGARMLGPENTTLPRRTPTASERAAARSEWRTAASQTTRTASARTTTSAATRGAVSAVARGAASGAARGSVGGPKGAGIGLLVGGAISATASGISALRNRNRNTSEPAPQPRTRPQMQGQGPLSSLRSSSSRSTTPTSQPRVQSASEQRLRRISNIQDRIGSQETAVSLGTNRLNPGTREGNNLRNRVSVASQTLTTPGPRLENIVGRLDNVQSNTRITTEQKNKPARKSSRRLGGKRSR